MTSATRSRIPPMLSWTNAVPVLSLLALLLTWGRETGPILVTVVALMLAGSVLAAVHHAEVVAHRVGEPFGSLVLAVAVTIIEVALIVTLMISGGPEAATLARDTVFAAVMITTNGIIGLSLLRGALKYQVVPFNAEGSGAALATVTTLAVLSMVVPTFTTSTAGPEFTTPQLVFAALASLTLYGMFVFTQTVRHRDFFLPVEMEDEAAVEANDEHAPPPSNREAWTSLGLLLVALVAVVGLAKVESPAIEAGVASLGLPQSFVGVVIALLVLLPETLAAVRAAGRGRVQISLNLGYGSAMASIGLTVPVIALATIWLDGPLMLGLEATHMVLLAMTVVVSMLTVVPGRATRLQGGVHLVLLAAFLFLAVNP
ncbi:MULTISPECIES: calcium:proton antiporter [Actinosynnema]|uniref:calcium:proton antiporter n=1 Tax=Actinosynnema TaxID=40566 RepID=UPI0020A39C40|nr:calcium:proton antiporter [Actinosynnema pretiosum]MCP2098253.1 Ca2+:H+ antiporter [Actinosynnema pretiosum]